jgi:type IX secretion system PorP/SprF family membrane protein
MMKFIRTFFLLMLVSLFAKGQQKPQYTQYILNNYIINPAISGIESYIDAKAATRRQWVGLENAPETSYFTVHLPIGKSNDWGSATATSAYGENPLGRSYKEEYQAAAPHHGIGMVFVSDKTGPLSSTAFNLTYAYHLGLAPKVNLSFGVGAGFNKISLNTNEITLEDPNDLAISQTGLISQFKPDVNIGLWLYSVDFFVGAAVQQLMPQSISFSDSSSYNTGKTVPHLFTTAGYRFWLNDDITLIPSVMVKKVNPAPLSVDFNLKMTFRDKIWIGTAYRKNDSFSGLVGFNVGSYFNLGYSYDFTTSALNTVSKGSHEIVLGLMLNNLYKITCPNKFW